MKMSGGEIALRTLENLGVRHIFGMPGGVVLPLYDHFKKLKKLRHI